MTGDALDGKLVVTNGYAGSKKWTGTSLDGYAIMSTNTNENETKAGISFCVAVSENSLLKFKVKVDSDIGDVFLVTLDHVRYAGVGNLEAGEYDISIPLSEGEHDIAFIYSKDDSGFDGTDTVYVSKGTLEPFPVIIDGEKDAIYNGIAPVPVRHPISTNPHAWIGGGTAYVTNDKCGIYVYVEVIDTAIVEDTDGITDNEDGVKLYIDFARSYYDECLEGLDYRNTAKPGGMKLGWISCTPAGEHNPTGVLGGGCGFEDVGCIMAASTLTDNGYAVEFFIPIAYGWLQSDNRIGFGIQIYDDSLDEDNEFDATFYSDAAANGSASWWSYYDTLPEYELK